MNKILLILSIVLSIVATVKIVKADPLPPFSVCLVGYFQCAPGSICMQNAVAPPGIGICIPY